MKFDLILQGNIDTVNNFDQRIHKLAELLDININFIGPFLGAKESVVMSNLEFTEARNQMTKITDLGFKAEVRPTRKKNSQTTENTASKSTPPSSPAQDNLILNQNRASFKAPTDMPQKAGKPLKDRVQPLGSSIGSLQEIDDADGLCLADDQTDGNFNKYNWSKDLDSDEVVKFEEDLVIKKGR